MVQNKGLVLAEYPQGLPVAGKHLIIESREFDIEQQPPTDGITVKVHYVSFDPYQRNFMKKPASKDDTAYYEIGKPISNSAVVSVLKSDNAKFQPGDILYSTRTLTEEYSVVDKASLETFSQLENPYNLDLKLFTGALGMSGLTAYSSFYAVGRPKKGETIFISAAAGAVGQLVGQLAKHEGLKVFGSVGDDAKLDYIVKDLGFDGGFNYKKEKPLDALKRLAPEGIDIYYENVGGEHLEAALTHLRMYGRIVACGMISTYNNDPGQAYGVRNLMLIIAKQLRFEGFFVYDPNMGGKYAAEHQQNVQKWIHEGSFSAKMSVTRGIDHAAEGLLALYSGKNFGKAVLEVSAL